MKKGSSKCISVVKRVVPQSRGTSNGTFVTDRVGDIEISFVEYSASKKVRLQPDIVEYSLGDQGMMQANVGHKVMLLTFSQGYFLYQFLHMMVS